MGTLRNPTDVSLDAIFTLGQTIDWIEGYRTRQYPFVGRSSTVWIDTVLERLSDFDGSRPQIEIGRGTTPIPIYKFYDSSGISGITDEELQSLYQFSTTFYKPEYTSYYRTDINWEEKPFVSVLPGGGSYWKGIRNAGGRYDDGSAYDDVFYKGDGPQMPLANFKTADQKSLNVKPIETFLTVPEVISFRNEPLDGGVSFIWQGQGSEPALAAGGKYTVTNNIKLSNERGATNSSKNNSEWNIKGSLDLAFNISDITKQLLPFSFDIGGETEKNNDEASNTKTKNIAVKIEGGYKSLSENYAEEVLKEASTEEVNKTHEYEIPALDSRIDWSKIKTMTFDDYYNKYKDSILANPDQPAIEATDDGTRILISGAEVMLGYKQAKVVTRSSIVNTSEYSGQVLGEVWQGFLAATGSDYLLTSDPSDNVIDVGKLDWIADDKVSQFSGWLKQNGKNNIGNIYKKLEDLGFVRRIWGDNPSIEVNRGGDKGVSTIPLVEYINDGTIIAVTSVPFTNTMLLAPEYEFSQTYNGKSLSDAVLSRHARESGNSSSLLLSDRAIRFDGQAEPFENIDDSKDNRPKMTPRPIFSQKSNDSHVRGSKSGDVFNIDASNQIGGTLDLRKDVSADTIDFDWDGGDITGHLNIINFDPARDSLTGELVDYLEWSFDPIYDVARGVLPSDGNLPIQQAREAAHNGETVLINVYISHGKFKEDRNGRVFEKRSKRHNDQEFLDKLNVAEFPTNSTLLAGLVDDPLPPAVSGAHAGPLKDILAGPLVPDLM